MAKTDWDWPAQLENCERTIAELEAGIASQERKIRQLLKAEKNAEFANRVLAIRQESLARVRGYKRLIEARVAEGAAQGRATELVSALAKLKLSNGAPNGTRAVLLLDDKTSRRNE
jgi:hypothetical protein